MPFEDEITILPLVLWQAPSMLLQSKQTISRSGLQGVMQLHVQMAAFLEAITIKRDRHGAGDILQVLCWPHKVSWEMLFDKLARFSGRVAGDCRH